MKFIVPLSTLVQIPIYISHVVVIIIIELKVMFDTIFKYVIRTAKKKNKKIQLFKLETRILHSDVYIHLPLVAGELISYNAW